MIKIQGTLPTKLAVGVSGGPDSMAVLDFLRNGKRDVLAVFCHHNTEGSDSGHTIVKQYCNAHDIELKFARISDSQWDMKYDPSDSLEAYYRDFRLKVFKSLDIPVVTAHHLDDCVEEYIINTLKRGRLGTIPYRHANIVRPFRTTKKKSMVLWCKKKNVPFFSDPMNDSPDLLRSNIRHSIVYEIRDHVNPGIDKLVLKSILAEEIEKED